MTYDGYTKYDAAVAADYEADRRGEEHWRAEQQFMTRFVGRHRLGRVLDVPVGTGRFFELYGSAAAVVGVDISPHMLQIAGRKPEAQTLRNLQLSAGDATALAFPDAHFDSIVCFRLVHLLPAGVVTRLFNELARVACGRLVVQVYAAPAKGGFGQALRVLGGRLLRPLRGSVATKPWSHIQSYAHTAEFLEGAAQSAGLRLVEHHVLCQYGRDSVDVLELEKCLD
jgi:ubiquinone/menaquinone biosynthesis C-methylase UbiE